MPQGMLRFSLPEEEAEFTTASKAGSMRAALFEIQQKVFRPARKHGYQDEGLQNLTPQEMELIGKLETLFIKVLEENNVLDQLD